MAKLLHLVSIDSPWKLEIISLNRFFLKEYIQIWNVVCGKDKMATMLHARISYSFSWNEIVFWFEFNRSLRVQLAICQHWFRLWLGTDQATSCYLNHDDQVYWCIYVLSDLNELKTYINFNLDTGTYWVLTLLPLVPHIYVIELGQHWFR